MDLDGDLANRCGFSPAGVNVNSDPTNGLLNLYQTVYRNFHIPRPHHHHSQMFADAFGLADDDDGAVQSESPPPIDTR